MKVKEIEQAQYLTRGFAGEILVGYRTKTNPLKLPKIHDSESVFRYIMEHLPEGLVQEIFGAIFMNRANRIIGFQPMIFVGGISGTVVDVRIISAMAVITGASHVIIFHNHPSGNLGPSSADEEVTRKIKAGLETLDIRLLDHLIISGDEYYSFADESRIL